jgi:hypothetical protein
MRLTRMLAKEEGVVVNSPLNAIISGMQHLVWSAVAN